MAFAPAGARRTAKTCGHGATHVWDGCHGTVATLWHTRRHCRKNFSAIVATGSVPVMRHAPVLTP